MSPLGIEIMLWHYGRAEQYPEWHKGSAQRELRDDLLREGMLAPVDSRIDQLVITDKGRAYVEHLMGVPFPVCKWVIPEGDK